MSFPFSPTLLLRLTSDMKMDTDILIVGGGVSGSAMGAALVSSGHRALCIDQGTGGP